MINSSKDAKLQEAASADSEQLPVPVSGRKASNQAETYQGMTALAPLTGLPMRLDLKLPVTNFRVSDLASLAAGQLFMTSWSIADDLPMFVGEEKIVWTEFAVSEEKLMMRVTRIA